MGMFERVMLELLGVACKQTLSHEQDSHQPVLKPKRLASHLWRLTVRSATEGRSAISHSLPSFVRHLLGCPLKIWRGISLLPDLVCSLLCLLLDLV